MSQSDLFKIQQVYTTDEVSVSFPSNNTYAFAFGHHPQSRDMVFLMDESVLLGFVTTDFDSLEEIRTPVYCQFCEADKESGAFFDEFETERDVSLPLKSRRNVQLVKNHDRFVCEECLDRFLVGRGHILADQR